MLDDALCELEEDW